MINMAVNMAAIMVSRFGKKKTKTNKKKNT